MTGPQRVQLRRTAGWRKPEGAVTVARPTKWGNPFPVDGDWMVWTAVALGYKANKEGRRAAAVALHRAWLTGEPIQLGPFAAEGFSGAIEFSDGTVRSVNDHARGIAAVGAAMYPPPVVPATRPDVTELAGLDLCCWCPLDGPCHGDTLLALANLPDPDARKEGTPDAT